MRYVCISWKHFDPNIIEVECNCGAMVRQICIYIVNGTMADYVKRISKFNVLFA